MGLKVGTKINLKLYIPLSFGTTALFIPFLNNKIEIYTHLGIYIATLLNLYMLVLFVQEMFTEGKFKKEKSDKMMISIYAVCKLLVLFGALSFGVQFIGNRIIIPVINYIMQIFILVIGYTERNR